VIVAVCLADRMVHLPAMIRVGLLAALAGGVLAILARPLMRLMRRNVDWLAAAQGLERRHPAFAQRLQTVVSQGLADPAQRGSGPMLEQLTAQVQCEVEQDRLGRWSDWRPLAGPWGLALAILVLLGQLSLIPSIDMATLLSRLFMPLAQIDPATTTRIAVEPGDASLRVGDTLVIKAHVTRLGDSSVDLLTSQDRSSWARIPMQAAGNQYTASLAAPQRDFYYCVQGGDATTRVFKATILRPPAVAAYRIRYEYPAYTRRGERVVSSTDGLIEAIEGTTVQLSLVSTETMAAVNLLMDGQRLAMRVGADAHVCQATFVLRKSQRADMEMISGGGLTSRTSLMLRAQSDREPMVRLVQPAEDLRLHPLAMLQIQYSAADDYGVAALAAAAQVNAAAAVQLPIVTGGDPRRPEGQCALDLASLNVKVGDVLSLWLVAQDGAGHKAVSEVRRILVAPQSIDAGTHRRIAQLRQAARLAEGAQRELKRAADSLDEVRRASDSGDEQMTARSAVSGALANAVEDSLLLHQMLLRVCVDSASALQTTALAHGVDQARMLAWQCERLTLIDAVDASEPMLVREVGSPTEMAGRLAGQLKVLDDGDQAAALLADLGNLRTQPADKAVAEKFGETLRRARQAADASAVQLGLRPQAQDLEARLQQMVEAADQLMRSLSPLDFSSLAMEWSAAMQKTDAVATSFSERLASAAMVEALRPDAEPIIARDWQLAGQAAQRLGQMALSHPGDDAGPLRQMLDGLPRAIAALQREHEMLRHPSQPLSLEQLGTTRQEAATARMELARWAKRTEISGAEELAMEASALTAQRDYASAEAIDRRLSGRLASSGAAWRWEAIQRAMTRARNIDRLSVEQASLVERSASAAQGEAAALSQRQRQVAEQIDRIEPENHRLSVLVQADHADARRLAGEAIGQAREQLALMPQQLAKALEAAEAQRQQASRTGQADREAKAASGSRQPAAQRAAELAHQALRQTRERLAGAMTPLSAAEADRLVQQLRSWGPETEPACQRLAGEIQPALALLEQAAAADDKSAMDGAARRVREALEAVQKQLRQAQAAVIESDPLVAARWYAQAAARSLAAQPPLIEGAKDQQRDTSLSLHRAWQDAVRESASERLSATPRFHSILSPLAGSSASSSSLGLMEDMPAALRPWGPLGTQQPRDLAAPLREADPHGYQDALRVYFDALDKAQEQGPRK
jgi:hypothetical protein